MSIIDLIDQYIECKKIIQKRTEKYKNIKIYKEIFEIFEFHANVLENKYLKYYYDWNEYNILINNMLYLNKNYTRKYNQIMEVSDNLSDNTNVKYLYELLYVSSSYISSIDLYINELNELYLYMYISINKIMDTMNFKTKNEVLMHFDELKMLVILSEKKLNKCELNMTNIYNMLASLSKDIDYHCDIVKNNILSLKKTINYYEPDFELYSSVDI